MTATSRFANSRLALLSLALLALGAWFAVHVAVSHAALPWTVTITPSAASFPAGGDGTFLVHVEGVGTQLPALDYRADGGQVTSAGALHSVSAAAAEATVHVTRATAGPVTVSAGFAGQTLASSQGSFVAMGSVGVAVTLDAGPDAAARTWRFEVTDASGAVVSTLDVSTSGDALTSSAASAPLPYGVYGVRQVLGSDTATGCVGRAFYAVAAPLGAATHVSLDSATATATFTIKPCGATDLSVNIPIDTVTFPSPAAAGEVAPGQTPINEVRGIRSAGPGAAVAATPLAPATGSGMANRPAVPAELLSLFGLLLVLVAPPAAWCAVRRQR